MSTRFQVDILTPDATLYSGEATYVGLPGVDGSLGVLAGHAPLITTLRAGDVTVRTDREEQRFTVQGGTVEVLGGRVTVLAE
jgi:F-type H+-transporting ATPase subunit epsilon